MWINEVGKHFLGVPFGGVKQSGIGREEGFEEMLAFTQEKNIHVQAEAPLTVTLAPRSGETGGERSEPGKAPVLLCESPSPAPPSAGRPLPAGGER